MLAQLHRSAAYRGTMPVIPLSLVLYICVCGSLAYITLILCGGWQKRSVPDGLKRVFYWICAGVLVNACICGAASAVDSRYQARVGIWLLPMVALLVELHAWRNSRKDEAADDGEILEAKSRELAFSASA